MTAEDRPDIRAGTATLDSFSRRSMPIRRSPPKGRTRAPAGLPTASWLARAALILPLAIAGACLLAAPAQAQSSEAVMEQVKRLQRELNTLQRYVYRDEKPPASAIEEVYGAQGGVNQTQAARIDLRLSQLESELRGLTGQIEEQSFRMDRLNTRVDKLIADMDARLRRLEDGGGRPLTSGSATGLGGTGQASLGSEPGTLGTVSEQAVAAVRGGGEVASPSAAPAGGSVSAGAAALGGAAAGSEGDYDLPGVTPEEKYSHAFSLLSQANYEQAERALSAFLKEYPNHRLAGNAKYWLGETHYVRGQYQDAAVAFAEGYQIYPDSAKAPDNLLKLGKSLAALGETNDACGTYGELIRRFPSASSTVLKQADQERRRLACP